MKRALAIFALTAVALLFGYYASRHPMDFRVYHYGARGVFEETRPVYGPASGLGWPMHYRYPPLFLLLFAPFAMLPLGLAAALWVVAKIGVLVWLMTALKKRGLQPATTYSYLLSLLIITPYIIEEFRYGNAQFFVLALTIAALLALRQRPALSAGFLALAISIKVWPAFFLPYLLVRREWKPVAYTLGLVVLMALLPSMYFGFSENLDLLGQWVTQESRTQLSESEIWFPNQSLRGVFMRYLTEIDYSQVPDSNYPKVNVASMNPATVRGIWMILAGAIYAGFLFVVSRRNAADDWLDLGLAFCLIAILEPFTQKYALAVLLWPAMIADRLMKKPLLRILVISAVVFVLIQPLTPGASSQRLLQVLGIDFAATFLLTLAFAVASFQARGASTLSHNVH